MEGETKGDREAWADQPANDVKHTEITSYSSHSPRKDMFEGTWWGGGVWRFSCTTTCPEGSHRSQANSHARSHPQARAHSF